MQLAKNPIFHVPMKQIEVHYHFVHERVLSGEVELWYVHTNQQVVEIFTKAQDEQVVALLGDAWYPAPRRVALEGESS